MDIVALRACEKYVNSAVLMSNEIWYNVEYNYLPNEPLKYVNFKVRYVGKNCTRIGFVYTYTSTIFSIGKLTIPIAET